MTLRSGTRGLRIIAVLNTSPDPRRTGKQCYRNLGDWHNVRLADGNAGVDC